MRALMRTVLDACMCDKDTATQASIVVLQRSFWKTPASPEGKPSS